jgi:inorganic pyrophosphatase
MNSLLDIAAFWGDGSVRVIVETPRGSNVRLKYDQGCRTFTGLSYPFDWGFVPGTRGGDGEALDALAIHDTATFPGVMLSCRVLGLVEFEQTSTDNHKRQLNNRIIAIALWHDRWGALLEARKLPERMLDEIEQFFLNANSPKSTPKGWKSAADAERYIKAHMTTHTLVS